MIIVPQEYVQYKVIYISCQMLSCMRYATNLLKVVLVSIVNIKQLEVQTT